MIAGERRQVTVLFADMVGYTAILEQLGEDSFAFVRLVSNLLKLGVDVLAQARTRLEEGRSAPGSRVIRIWEAIGIQRTPGR